MAITIFSLVSTFLFFQHQLISAAAFSPISVAAPPVSAAPSPSPSTSVEEFIHTNCQTTLYPDVCFRSLSRHAEIIQHDSALLARAAIGVSLSRAKRLATYVSNLTRQTSDSSGAASALQDCYSVFGDAVEQMRESLKQMLVLDGSGESLRFEMSNVQTYMSAALTNEDTCTDGFEEVDDGPMKRDICDRTVKVKQVTSNALALVNTYVSKVTNP